MKTIAIDVNDVIRNYSKNLIFYYSRWKDRDEKFDPDNVKYTSDDLYSCIPFKNDKERLSFITEEFVFELNAATKACCSTFHGKFVTWLKDFEEEHSEDGVEVLVMSPFENDLEIQATLFFLSKTCVRVRKILFPSTFEEIWNNADILITANPKLLKEVPENKITIKIKTEYNKKCKSTYEYNSFMDLIEEENIDNLNKLYNKIKKNEN